MTEDTIFIGRGDVSSNLALKYANRHGLITGATGTGKTVTLQILAESFSAHGVPVFLADVKGDLAGLSQPGVEQPVLSERARTIGLEEFAHRRYPVIFWDLFGKSGHPVRTTVSEMGPLLLARLLQLNETQEGVLSIAFRLADDQGLLLLDLKDLRSLLVYLVDNAKEIAAAYGNVSRASIGAIQRRLLMLEDQGARNFFGEPALELKEFLKTDENGEGYINILAADRLMQAPRLYATFLLWLISELFEELPEIGDPDRPRLVFFFDEAHLLFKDASDVLLDKIATVVRLIRSKGVGIYFVTQNPADVPDEVLSQLGNRIQHALRAFTPRDQKAVRVAADTFRPNPNFDAREVITQLGVGEALVSTLQKKGIPGIVERTLIRPPASRMGPITEAERAAVRHASPIGDLYDRAVDRKSAHEMLADMASNALSNAPSKAQEQARAQTGSAPSRPTAGAPRRGSSRQSVGEAFAKSIVRQIGSQIGRALIRGILGSMKKR